MDRKKLIEKFKLKAKQTAALRRDPRYRRTLGFLIQIGFLKANEEYPPLGNQRLKIKDAIWAGQKVEPRILEVLPAAFARLPKRFDYDPEEVAQLIKIVQSLRESKDAGQDFMGVPYEKVLVWYNHPILDGRTKTPDEKKIPRNFRFKPEVIRRLEKRAKADKLSVTDLIEKLTMNHA
jgi:hypothetical protein